MVIPPNATGGFQAGTYDRVYRGATIIETDKGKLIVNPNQVGFTPGKGIAPVLLPKIPEFFESKSRRPDVVKDQQKDSKDADESDPKKGVVKGSSARSLSTVKGERETPDSKDATTNLRSPLDATTVKDLGTTTLTTPLADTTIRSSTTILDTSISSPLKTKALIEPITIPTTTLRSTDILTAPTTTTTTTFKAPTTTTITSPITTTIAPITTTTTKITEPVIAPTTTTILRSPTTTTITK